MTFSLKLDEIQIYLPGDYEKVKILNKERKAENKTHITQNWVIFLLPDVLPNDPLVTRLKQNLILHI